SLRVCLLCFSKPLLKLFCRMSLSCRVGCDYYRITGELIRGSLEFFGEDGFSPRSGFAQQ
ncbi:MAG: hypothetical protein ACOY4D_06025, partial [Pseudomonadota bacterium]